MDWSPSFKSLVLACALLAGGCDRQSSAPRQPEAEASAAKPASKLDRSKAGTALPDVTVRDPDGEELSLDSLKGQPVLINLWATWCAPCVKELPTFNAIANRADVGVQVVTVSQDMGDAAAVQQFLDARGLAQLPAWIDAEGALPYALWRAGLADVGALRCLGPRSVALHRRPRLGRRGEPQAAGRSSACAAKLMATPAMELYACMTPNTLKAMFMLGELDLPFEVRHVRVYRGEQFAEGFETLHPYRKLPVLVDPQGPDGAPFTVFESGAILIYLAEKYGNAAR